MDRFFAIVNPAAGGGRSAKLAGPALARLREKGLRIDVIASTSQGHGVQLAREAATCNAWRWVSCPWARAIPFCAISQKKEPRLRCRRCWRAAREPSTF